MKCAVRQDSGAQTAVPLQIFFRAGLNGTIHPITWPAFSGAVKPHPLDFEILSNQLIQIDLAGQHIASNQRRRAGAELERAAKIIQNLEREKRDLPFVIFFEIEKSIAPNSVPGHAVDRPHFQSRIFIRFALMMAKKIMPRRNVKVTDFHCCKISSPPQASRAV